MTETTGIFDSLEVIVRDSSGRVKDTRYVKTLFGYSWQFQPNRLYLRLSNEGYLPFRIHGFFGKWSVVHA